MNNELANKVRDLRLFVYQYKTKPEAFKTGFDSACHYVLRLINGASIEDFTLQKAMDECDKCSATGKITGVKFYPKALSLDEHERLYGER
jgi:hypothetical protein